MMITTLPFQPRPGLTSQARSDPASFTVEYLGCLITVHSARLPGVGVRGSYAIVPATKQTARAFEERGISEISGDTIDAADAQHLCEWAKCELDFMLEVPF